MADKIYPIRSDEVAALVCEALDINPHMVRRIVLDLEANEPVMAYVEMYGSQRLLDIQWSFNGAVVQFADDINDAKNQKPKQVDPTTR